MSKIYKAFHIDDIFKIETPKLRINANTVTIHDYKKGHPYVVRTSQNNGIRGYIEFDEKYLNPANTISFGQDTATMFYQEEPYFTGDKIKIMSLKHESLNYRNAVYLLACMRKAFSQFSWGQSKFEVSVIGSIEIELPIITDDENTPIINLDYKYHPDGFIPDFNYMRERIAELERERIAELERYLIAAGLNDYKLTEEDVQTLSPKRNNKIRCFDDNHRTFREEEFKIGELFDIATGRDVIIGKSTDGNIPLISHQNTNNGVAKYINLLKNRRLFDYRKTIALADRGVFFATVQTQDFHIGTRVKALILHGSIKNKEVLIYLAAAINKLQILFTEYLVNATDKLPFLTIRLPICVDEKNVTIYDDSCVYSKQGYIPDFDYMEKYIRAIQKITIADVVRFKARVIEETKNIVSDVI